MTAKLSKLVGIRLSDADRERLARICARVEKEPVDFIRDAALAEVVRQEQLSALAEVERLRAASLDLSWVVDVALARKALEDAQARLPGFFLSKGGNL